MKVANDITELVGKTPLVRLNKITKGLNAEILVKLESFNPLSSVKDRIGKAMIEDAEKRGVLKKGSILLSRQAAIRVLGLAFVAAVKGYRLITYNA